MASRLRWKVHGLFQGIVGVRGRSRLDCSVDEVHG